MGSDLCERSECKNVKYNVKLSYRTFVLLTHRNRKRQHWGVFIRLRVVAVILSYVQNAHKLPVEGVLVPESRVIINTIQQGGRL